MKKTEPELYLDHAHNRNEYVINEVGALKVGQTAQVAFTHDDYPALLMMRLRERYPETVFKSEEFTYEGQKQMYIHIERHKKALP